MSDPHLIAATTASLRNLLLGQIPLIDTGLADLAVTTQPLDLARKGETKAQLNLFLYQTMVNAAWRNQDLPGRVRPGETGQPPLALNLHYLITAFGRGDSDNESVSHRVLGGAMSVLHDHPLLGEEEIKLALSGVDPGTQFERLRITALPMSIEEISKLWTSSVAPYRISAAYEVSVLLIDSRRPTRAPLPVLTRGAADRGPLAVAGLAPVLSELRLPRLQSAARLGEEFILAGDNLTVADSIVRVSSPLLTDDILIAPQAGDIAGELRVPLADVGDDPLALSRWHPGYFGVTLTQTRTDVPPISSNRLALALAPQIALSPLNSPAGAIVLTISCVPRLGDGQHVLLLFADRQIAPDAVVTPANPALPTTLTFTVPGVTGPGPTGPAKYVVRLRVDGIDSIPVIMSGTPPIPGFDPAQTLSVP